MFWEVQGGCTTVLASSAKYHDVMFAIALAFTFWHKGYGYGTVNCMFSDRWNSSFIV